MTRGARMARIVAPAALGICALAAWEVLVALNGIPSYVLPGPLQIARTRTPSPLPASPPSLRSPRMERG